MGETRNKVVGKTKKAAGRATGDPDLERRGRRQETAGKVQGGVRKAGRSVTRGIDKVAGRVSEAKPRRGERPGRVGRTTTERTTVRDETF